MLQNRYRLQTARSRPLRNQLGQIRMLTASTVFEVYAGHKSFGWRSGLLLLPCRTNAGQSVSRIWVSRLQRSYPKKLAIKSYCFSPEIGSYDRSWQPDNEILVWKNFLSSLQDMIQSCPAVVLQNLLIVFIGFLNEFGDSRSEQSNICVEGDQIFASKKTTCQNIVWRQNAKPKGTTQWCQSWRTD